MKKIIALLISALLFSSSLASAGVVMDLVTTNTAGKETERTRIQAQSGKMRMEDVEGDQATATMIFLGDKFLYIDHREKSYVVMDEAMLEEISNQVDEAMKEMEAQLANMPPEQRAMMEQMMKGRMQGMMAQQAAQRPAPRVEAVGSGKWQSHKCRQYEVFEGADKVLDVCAAALDHIEGADDVVETFRNMAAYITKLTESMPVAPDDGLDPSELMDQIDGFPVHTIDYENGVAVRTTLLDGVSEQDLDESMFAAPDGYRKQDPFGGR